MGAKTGETASSTHAGIASSRKVAKTSGCVADSIAVCACARTLATAGESGVGLEAKTTGIKDEKGQKGEKAI